MRRLSIALSVGVLAYLGPSAAAAPGTSLDRATCEGFCDSVVVGCRVVHGNVVGGSGCQAMYEACLQSCLGSVPED